MNKSIEMQVGIYESSARLICHRSGSVTIRYPIIVWAKNSGALGFRKVTLKNLAEKAKRVFRGDADTYLSEFISEIENRHNCQRNTL